MENNITIDEIMHDLIQSTIRQEEPRQPGEMTAQEVAELTGTSKNIAYKSLSRAAERGEMKTRKVSIDGHITTLFSPSDKEIERRKNGSKI